jgi:hypothetical protein
MRGAETCCGCGCSKGRIMMERRSGGWCARRSSTEPTTESEAKCRGRRVRSRCAQDTETIVVVLVVCVYGRSYAATMRVGGTGSKRSVRVQRGREISGQPRATEWGWKGAPKTVTVDGAVPKENAGMAVAADEALLAYCERPPNAFTLLAAAGPPNAAVLLPSVVAAWLCAPNTPVKPARFERDGSHPALLLPP